MAAILALNVQVSTGSPYSVPTGYLFEGRATYVNVSVGGTPVPVQVNGVTMGVVANTNVTSNLPYHMPLSGNAGDQIGCTGTSAVISLTGNLYPQ